MRDVILSCVMYIYNEYIKGNTNNLNEHSSATKGLSNYNSRLMLNL